MALDQQEKTELMEQASEIARQAELVIALLGLDPVPFVAVRTKAVLMARTPTTCGTRCTRPLRIDLHLTATRVVAASEPAAPRRASAAYYAGQAHHPSHRSQ